jgi:hypothetical protein
MESTEWVSYKSSHIDWKAWSWLKIGIPKNPPADTLGSVIQGRDF